MLRAFGITDKGRVRSSNQDCFATVEALQFCVVADGMGGHNAGDIAARLAVDTILEYVRDSQNWPFGIDPSLSAASNRLRTAIHLANLRVLEASVESRHRAGMGTTVVAAIIEDRRLSVAHVGDSRLYVFANRRLRALTRDDSWTAAVLSADPRADQSAVRQHPMRNALTNVVGTRAHTSVHIVEEPIDYGALLVLTTDGVHGTLEDERIEQVMREGDDVRELAETLVAAALSRGSGDNCTAIVARYLSDEAGP